MPERRPREKLKAAAQGREVPADPGRLLESRRWGRESGGSEEAGVHCTQLQTGLPWEKTLQGSLEDSTVYRSAISTCEETALPPAPAKEPTKMIKIYI